MEILKKLFTAESSADKRAFKSTELVLALIAAFLIPANQALELGLPTESIMATIALVISYVTSRTLAKSAGQKIRSGIRSMEFWVTVGGSVLVVCAEALGLKFTPDQVMAFSAMLASLIAGRGVAKKSAASSEMVSINKLVDEKIKAWKG